MTRLGLTLATVLALTVPLVAQVQYVTLADVTVGAAAANVFSSSDVLAGGGHPAAQLAVCTQTGGNLRWTIDGTTPTTSLGTVQVPGQWTYVGTNVLVNLKAIRDDSTDAVLSCTLQRQ